MQVSVESTSGVERRMTIGVSVSQVDQEVEKRLKETARTVRLNGFRPGKVPLGVVRKRFGAGVRQEVLGEVMRTSFQEALESEKLQPLGYPRFEPKQLEAGKDLEFVAVFEVYPEVEIGDVSGIELVKEQAQVADADIDNMIEMLRKQSAGWEDADAGAEESNQLTINYKGSVDGEFFDGGSADDAKIVIGSGRMIPGFEEGLIGLKVGDDKMLEVKFPEDYHAENLKGKHAIFEVSAKKIEKSVLPEVDDEFYAQYGVSEGGLEAFRAELNKNMIREANFATGNKLKQQVVDALIERTEFDVPNAMMESEIDRLRQDAVQRFGGSANANINPEQLPAELFKEQAEKRVRTGLVFAQLVKDGELKASDEQMEEKARELASSYQEPDQVVDMYMNNQEHRAQLESVVLEDIVVDFVASKAKVETKDVSYEEAVKPATPTAEESSSAE